MRYFIKSENLSLFLIPALSQENRTRKEITESHNVVISTRRYQQRRFFKMLFCDSLHLNYIKKNIQLFGLYGKMWCIFESDIFYSKISSVCGHENVSKKTNLIIPSQAKKIAFVIVKERGKKGGHERRRIAPHGSLGVKHRFAYILQGLRSVIPILVVFVSISSTREDECSDYECHYN